MSISNQFEKSFENQQAQKQAGNPELNLVSLTGGKGGESQTSNLSAEGQSITSTAKNFLPDLEIGGSEEKQTMSGASASPKHSRGGSRSGKSKSSKFGSLAPNWNNQFSTDYAAAGASAESGESTQMAAPNALSHMAWSGAGAGAEAGAHARSATSGEGAQAAEMAGGAGVHAEHTWSDEKAAHHAANAVSTDEYNAQQQQQDGDTPLWNTGDQTTQHQPISDDPTPLTTDDSAIANTNNFPSDSLTNKTAVSEESEPQPDPIEVAATPAVPAASAPSAGGSSGSTNTASAQQGGSGSAPASSNDATSTSNVQNGSAMIQQAAGLMANQPAIAMSGNNISQSNPSGNPAVNAPSSSSSNSADLSLADFDQQLEAQLQQLQAQIAQMSAELAQVMNGANPATTPVDNTGATNPANTPVDNTGATNPATTPVDNTGATNPATTPVDNTNGTTNDSGFAIQNGQLLINGQLLSGVAVSGEYAQQVGPQELAQQISSQFPGINVVRLATSPEGGAFTEGSTLQGGETVQNIDQTIQALNADGIGVVVDNHGSDANTANNVSQDGAEPAWFAQLASDNMGNNMVMFQTENEPTGNNSDIVNEQQAAYNAIRGTGSNAVVAFDLEGGGSAAPMESDPAAYNADSNYVIDAHSYASNNSDPASVLQQEVAQTSNLTEANGGAVPVYIGETGNSIDGSNIDPAATEELNAVYGPGGTGAISWLYDGAATGFGNGNGADHLTNSDGSLSSYGQEVASLIEQNATTSSPATSDNQSTPAAPQNDTTPVAPQNDTTPVASQNDTTPSTPQDNTTPSTPVDNPNPSTPSTQVDNSNPSTPSTPVTPVDSNGTSPSSSTTPGAGDTYHVSGDQIIGPDGQPFVMTGINDTESTEHDELTGSFGTLASEGANTVRLMGTAADLENPNDSFNQEVQSALNAGMFVDISESSDESEYGATGGVYSAADTAEAAQALQTSAAMYANNPNVGFNVANEQGASGDATNPQLLANTETLLQAVNTGAQSVNPNADPIKFVDDSEWGQGAFDPNYQSQSFLYNNAAALESYGNVVGAVHDYESSAGQYNTAGVNAIQQEGMPVIAEEVGVQDPTVAADSFNTLSQTQSTTGEPIGGLVWVDGTGPDGTFYNNVMNTAEAPAVQNFWQSVDSQAGAASPTGVSSPADNTTPAAPADSTTPSTPVDNTTPPNPNTTPATPNLNTPSAPSDTNNPATSGSSGDYSVVNGQIIGPDGQPFDAKGVAVFAADAPADAATILQQMPDLNFIRLAATPGSDTPADIQADIQAFQNINPNVVVEVEDHTSGGTDGTTNNTLSGSDLTNEENWYSQIAAANVNNPNVWFGTANEPNDPSDEQNVVDQESGIYNAIRGTGSNAMVMLEADGGGFFGPQQADPGAYANMTNVAWDDHYYGWETANSADGGTSVQENVAAIQSEIAGANGITESNGAGGQQAIPTIIGEYGNSTTGAGVDSNATAAVNGVQTANNEGLVQGAVGWVWDAHNNPDGDSDAITQDGTMNTATNFGQEVINYVNTGELGNAS